MTQMADLSRSGSLVPDLLMCASRRFPAKPAVRVGEDVLTFAQVDERASRLAGLLHERGVRDGRRVALLAMNDLEYLEVRVGAQRAGAVLVPLNYRLAAPELEAMIEDADCDLLIMGRGLAAFDTLAPAVPRLQLGEATGEHAYEPALAAAEPAAPVAGFDPEPLCHISYTSGTTARPKGVMLSNRAIHAGTMAMGHELGSRPDAVFLVCTPMFHVGSQVPFSCTFLGGTLVQLQKFDVPTFVAALSEHGITHCQMVPTMIAMALDAWPEGGEHSLQRILYGAAPMPAPLLRRAIETWGCEFVNGYGSTESMGISFLTPGEHDAEHAPGLLHSVGRSSALTVSRLVDDTGQEPAPGEVGEVLARGPALMSGYWRNPQATAQALRDGWMHTGDLAYRDEDGYLYLVDRRNDKIVTGGENVFPSEIEQVLLGHEGVAEVAVVGAPDATWGEAVTAFVVPREGAAVGETTLMEHCRAALAGYKVPKRIHVREEPLPRSATGKLLRRELRRELSEAS